MNQPIHDTKATAHRGGDGWLRCGACGYRMAFRLGPTGDGARMKCQSCGTWNASSVDRVEVSVRDG